MKLSMIVPVFREESRLPEGLSDLQSFLARLPLDLELVLVTEPGEAAAAREAVARVAGGPRPLRLDDGAGADAPPAHQDISSETKPAGAPPIRVQVLENPRRLGRGPSVQRGLGAAGGDLLIVLSADLNIPLAESFAAVQEYLRDPEGTGFILGNRRSLKRPRHGVRAPLKKLFDDIEHDKASGLEVPDPTSPFWAITREWWQKAATGPGGPLKLRRWYYTPELVRRLRELRAPIKSLDIHSHDTPETRFHWWHSLFH